MYKIPARAPTRDTATGEQVFTIQIHTCDSGLESFEILTILPYSNYIL